MRDSPATVMPSSCGGKSAATAPLVTAARYATTNPQPFIANTPTRSPFSIPCAFSAPRIAATRPSSSA